MFISLPLAPTTDFQKYFEDQKYTYITISKVEKPARRSKKTEEDYKKWEDQQETLKRLDSGYYNCYNHPITPSGIDNEVEHIVNEPEHYIVYKIKPTSCSHCVAHSFSFKSEYKIYEFEVVKRIENLAELYQSLMGDYILEMCVAKLIDGYKYNNKIEQWSNIILTIREAVPDLHTHLFITDIIQWLEESKSMCSKTRDTMLLDMIKNGDMQAYSQYYDNYNGQIDKLIRLGLGQCAVYYTKDYMYHKEIVLNDETIRMLQCRNDVPEVAELVQLLKPKFPGMKLIIKKTEYYDDSYGSQSSTEEVEVKDANEAKKYIIKNFDVDFSYMQREIKDIYIREDDIEYTFELRS